MKGQGKNRSTGAGKGEEKINTRGERRLMSAFSREPVFKKLEGSGLRCPAVPATLEPLLR